MPTALDTPEKRMMKDQVDLRRLAWSAAARDKETKEAIDKVCDVVANIYI
jgi:hypothetical protein